MDLANKVRQRREQLGLSQDELAKRMGYSSRTSINKIENGRPCSQKIIVRLAEALDTDVPYLMGWEESKKEQPTQDSELSENQKKIIEIVKTLSEEDARILFEILQRFGGRDA